MENTEVKDLQNEETGKEVKPIIDLEKFDKEKNKKDEPVNEIEQLKQELIAAQKKADDEAKRALAFKKSFDTKASEVARLTGELRETKKDAEEPNEKLLEYQQQLAEYELKEKKTNLLYSLTETLHVGKDMSDKIVSAIYSEGTNELSIGDLELALRELVDNVRDISYRKGYETRDVEYASGKPRSIGQRENLSLADQKKQEYLEKKNRHRR